MSDSESREGIESQLREAIADALVRSLFGLPMWIWVSGEIFVDGEDGVRPYLYLTFEEAKSDAEHLTRCGEYSTCS